MLLAADGEACPKIPWLEMPSGMAGRQEMPGKGEATDWEAANCR